MANSLTEFDAEEAYRDIRNDGYEEGLAQGASQKAIEAALNALKMNLSIEQVSQITNLSQAEVIELSKDMVPAVTGSANS